MEEKHDLKRYSRDILRKIGEGFQIEITCKELLEKDSKDKYYSKILKSGFDYSCNGVDFDRFITSAEIRLNYQKLNTLAKVRRAISHELAHLFPDKKSFVARWSFWNKNLKKFEEGLHETVKWSSSSVEGS